MLCRRGPAARIGDTFASEVLVARRGAPAQRVHGHAMNSTEDNLMLVPYLKTYLHSLKKHEDGVTMIEYGLLAALIAVALIVTVVMVQDSLEGTFTDVSTGLNNN